MLLYCLVTLPRYIARHWSKIANLSCPMCICHPVEDHLIGILPRSIICRTASIIGCPMTDLAVTIQHRCLTDRQDGRTDIYRSIHRRCIYTKLYITFIRNSSGDGIANVNFFTTTSSTTFIALQKLPYWVK